MLNPIEADETPVGALAHRLEIARELHGQIPADAPCRREGALRPDERRAAGRWIVDGMIDKAVIA